MTTLYLYNFSISKDPQVPFYKNNQSKKSYIPFVMKTCQRTLVISSAPLKFKTDATASIEGTEAYAYVLEMLCGLKSRLIAENEIVSQFKCFLSQYMSYINRDSELIPCLQKLLQDCKSIRSKYLIGISQKTYAALSKKIMRAHEISDKPILIHGTGQLAEDLINQFKKSAQVFITGRNSEKIENLVSQHEIMPFEWKNYSGYLNFQFQINTIGTNEPIFHNEFTLKWNKTHNSGVFIDLGEPSPLENPQNITSGHYYGLDKIYEKGAIENTVKKNKIEAAINAIENLSEKRQNWFIKQFHKKQEYLNDNLYNRKQRKSTGQGTGFVY